MAFTVYHHTEKQGKLSSKGAAYKVFDSAGEVKGDTAMTIIPTSTGLYFASVDPTGWIRNADGFYWIHMYETGKANIWSKVKEIDLLLIDGDPVGIDAGSKISDIHGKLPTNYIMGSSSQADQDGKFDAVTLKAVTHTGAVIPSVSLVDVATLVNTLSGHTPQTGDSFAIVSDGSNGNAAIRAQVNKLDLVATTAPTGAGTGSLLDRLCNDGPAKTYDQTLHSLEAIRKRGDVAWLTGGGAGGGSFFDILVIANAVTQNRKISLVPRDGGIVVTTSNCNMEIKRRVPGSTPGSSQVLSAASPTADGTYDFELNFTPAVGEIYTITGTITFGTTPRSVVGAFTAQ